MAVRDIRKKELEDAIEEIERASRRAMRWAILLLAFASGSLSADECSEYLSAQGLYAAADTAFTVEDWVTLGSDGETAELRAKYEALQTVSRKRNHAALAVQYAEWMRGTAALVVELTVDAADAADTANEVLQGWVSQNRAKGVNLEPARGNLGLAIGNLVEAHADLEEIKYRVITAFCSLREAE